MAYDFKPFKQELADVQEWLSGEFSGIRTGRATPALLDSIRVEAYGTKMPLNQVGNISVQDARTLRIIPWDASLAKQVEKAIIDADLGISAGADDQGVIVSFPELTSERREQLKKLIKDKTEQAKVSVRTERDKVWHDIQQQEKAGAITEDEKFRYKDEMEKFVTEANKTLDEMATKKEKEISQ